MKKDITVHLFSVLALLVVGMIVGSSLDDLAGRLDPTLIRAESSAVPHYPASMLDGKPMAPSSIHRSHGTIRGYGEDFQRDDGVMVKLFFIGGTDPTSLRDGMRGTIEVSVPSFDDSDDDGSYYFRSWTPDAK